MVMKKRKRKEFEDMEDFLEMQDVDQSSGSQIIQCS